MESFSIPWACLDSSSKPTVQEKPCVKGVDLAISIPEEEYLAGIDACKLNLHGRIIWPKGTVPLTVGALKNKLTMIWEGLAKWGVSSLGKGYYEFCFSSLEDVRKVRSVASWSLKPGLLKLFAWTKDFNPRVQQNYSAQVWVRFYGLSQEYWRPNILFAIASSIGTPICTDAVTAKPMIDQLNYENLPEYCSNCKFIGHSINNCKKLLAYDEGQADKIKVARRQVPLENKSKYAPTKDGRVQASKNMVETTRVENNDTTVIEGHSSGNKDKATLSAQCDKPEDLDNSQHSPRQISNVVKSQQPITVKNQFVALAYHDLEDSALEGNQPLEVNEGESTNEFVDDSHRESTADSSNNLEVSNQLKVTNRDKDNMEFLKQSWANMAEEEEEEEEANMKMLEDIESKLWLANLGLKLFEVNTRGSLLPNLWCICKLSLCPTVLAVDTHHVSFSVCDNGDFNSILGAHEHKGFCTPSRATIMDFQTWIDNNLLVHLPTTGAFFTWSNGRDGARFTERRLDRTVVNQFWLDSCTSLSCNTLVKNRMWSVHETCKDIIVNIWNENIIGCPMYILSTKLKRLKDKLKVWNKEIFGNVHDGVKEAEQQLQNIQQQIHDFGHSDHLLHLEKNAHGILDKALIKQELFWKEKSSTNWHIDGDRNTAYFHIMAKTKNATKLISSLKNGNDVLTKPSQIADHVVNYYKNLFRTNPILQDSLLVEEVIPSLISDNVNTLLTMLPSKEEIKNAVFSLNKDSAPGPDGFGAYFFQAYWEIIQNDVVNAVIQFFISGWILPNYNSNTIVLIPKIGSADTVEKFRPIALANFKFKIITKVLADKLAQIMPIIISKEQRGFIHGRNIKDCIGLTSEVINLLHNKSFGGNIAMKIDISKAFDTLDWTFLLKVLKQFVAWKKVCAPLDEGGLGLRSLTSINEASNLKLCWELMHSNEDWAVILRSRVFRDDKIINHHIYSSLWSSIKTENDVIGLPQRVSDLTFNQQWFVPPDLDSLFPNLKNMVNTVTLPVEPVLDQLCWNESSSGLMSLKLAYEFKRKHYTSKKWAKSIWCRDVPPSKSLLVWRLMHDKIPTDDKLMERDLPLLYGVGNYSSGVSSASVREFVILKSFNVSSHPPKPLILKEVIWQPPIPQWVKCNTDGASNTSTSSCGGIFRNHNADFLCAFAENTGLKSAFKAELCGVMRAIEIAAGKTWRNLWLETDSTLVVMAFKSSALVPWDLEKGTNVRIDLLI
ncbi:hypothetical protein TSUD_364120 [Trifolium subterraneum]|uniref:Reverse transcriptase domain-containing protein n=1 Tax=Trifolium subterraneum TaxID=3900 RepID=A0A2Z6MTL2_TRISU|nr:hypothetical protein TSUD_364120 [Trifolium subterraneum]